MNQTASQRTAAAVRAELARRRLSGRSMATALGWSAQSTWRRLSGNCAFDIDELATVADYLGVPLASLVPDEAAAEQVAS